MITKSGVLANCRIIQSLPFMDQPILAALAKMRVQPASFKGEPVVIHPYIIPLNLKLEASPAAPVTAP